MKVAFFHAAAAAAAFYLCSLGSGMDPWLNEMREEESSNEGQGRGAALPLQVYQGDDLVLAADPLRVTDGLGLARGREATYANVDSVSSSPPSSSSSSRSSLLAAVSARLQTQLAAARASSDRREEFLTTLAESSEAAADKTREGIIEWLRVVGEVEEAWLTFRDEYLRPKGDERAFREEVTREFKETPEGENTFGEMGGAREAEFDLTTAVNRMKQQGALLVADK